MTTIALRLPGWRGALGRAWPGLLLCAIAAIASAFIADTRGGPTPYDALLPGFAPASAAALPTKGDVRCAT